MDTGREFTERWHHQMQIRAAVSAPSLYGRTWLYPVLQLSVRAFPRALAGIEAGAGTSIVYRVRGEGGGSWVVRRTEGGWEVLEGELDSPRAAVETDEDTSWKIFFNALGPDELSRRITIRGEQALATAILAARAVMV